MGVLSCNLLARQWGVPGKETGRKASTTSEIGVLWQDRVINSDLGKILRVQRPHLRRGPPETWGRKGSLFLDPSISQWQKEILWMAGERTQFPSAGPEGAQRSRPGI